MIEMTLPYAAELLGEYLGDDWNEHRASVLLHKYDACFLAMEWETKQGRIETFYRDSSMYLLELLHWNSSSAFKAYQTELAPVSSLRIIDFGAGIGTISHQLARQGNEVIYCDVNERCLDFARWWGEKCGTDVTYSCGIMALTDEAGDIAGPKFDLVVAVDVMEHLTNLREWLRDIARLLNIGGRLYAKPSWGFQHVYPMHYDHSATWLTALEQAGFETKPSGWIRRIR